jgi:hypothetical protein
MVIAFRRTPNDDDGNISGIGKILPIETKKTKGHSPLENINGE